MADMTITFDDSAMPRVVAALAEYYGYDPDVYAESDAEFVAIQVTRELARRTVEIERTNAELAALAAVDIMEIPAPVPVLVPPRVEDTDVDGTIEVVTGSNPA